MKVAIMQPYFLPYIGYFQLMAAVDKFVVYDNIKYTKKGWINRNRMLKDGGDAMFSLPLKAASDFEFVSERQLASDFNPDKLLNQLFAAYRKAPFFKEVSSLVERIVKCPEHNLFGYIHHSLIQIHEYFELEVEVLISSNVDIDHGLRGQEKVLAICKTLGATTYINAIGGKELYSRDEFASHGVKLEFLQSMLFEYPQFGKEFVPWLSIVDLLMFNSKDAVAAYLTNNYELV